LQSVSTLGGFAVIDLCSDASSD